MKDFGYNIARIKMDFQMALADEGLKDEDIKLRTLTIIPTFLTTHVFVKLSRPGILIGRKGETIRKVIAKMEKFNNKRVKMYLKDYDPYWTNRSRWSRV